MRVILAAAAALAVLTVSGCDINTGTPRTEKVTCNCATPAPAVPPAGARSGEAPRPQARVHHHRDWRAAPGHGYAYRWHREYAEVSVQTYDYHSDSHSYYQGGERGGAYGATDGYAGGAHRGDHDRGDEDGAPVHDRRAADERERLHPWHGYDADCPDQDRHGGH
ncbi:MAG: hypothetical protein WDM91_10490 [Rhizomicrobium sp.]